MIGRPTSRSTLRACRASSLAGQVLWAREMSAHSGVAADWENIYVVGDQGELAALSRRNGADVWRNGILARREPTAPATFHTAVVVGDFEGYLHFFARTDGTLLARQRVGKGMISGKPVVAGERLLVQSESGTLSAFVVPSLTEIGNAPPVADDEDDGDPPDEAEDDEG